MRPLLACILLLTTVLAGCTEAPEATNAADDVAQDHDEHDQNETTNETADEDVPAPNAPPAANLSADVTSGAAPLAVNFTLDGSDADGDALSWSLSINGTEAANGTALPASFAHTFAAGNHTVVLSISDGDATAQADLTITAAAGEAGEAPSATEDRGWYIFDPATGLCHVKDYEEVAPGIYRSPLSGGDWFLAEDNDVDGLQVENNHPEQTSGNFSLDVPDCVDGDQVVL